MDEGIAGTVYGTVVVMATLVAGVGFAAEPGELTAVVGATVLVAWIAHVYAHGLAESINAGLRIDGARLSAIGRRERSILGAAIGPLAALVMGAAGLLRETTAVWLGLSIGLATLAVQGARYGRVLQLGRAGTAVAVAVNLSLGLVIVAFKVLLVH